MTVTEIMTPEAVAALLDKSLASLANWRSQNKGPSYIKFGNGGNVRYMREDVMSFLNKGRVNLDGSERS